MFIDYLWKETTILLTVVAFEDRRKEAGGVEGARVQRRINVFVDPFVPFEICYLLVILSKLGQFHVK